MSQDPKEIWDERPRSSRFRTPYARIAIEWITITLFAGVVAAILGVAAAVVYWAWT